MYERRRYANLTQLWLEGDHYKWRCMRANGIPEEYVTGNAPEYEKFLRSAQQITLPMTCSGIASWQKMRRYHSKFCRLSVRIGSSTLISLLS